MSDSQWVHMEWPKIAASINHNKAVFDKSYKCVNKEVPIKVETLEIHIKIIIKEYNNICRIVTTIEDRLTETHKKHCHKILRSLNKRLINISIRHNLDIQIPEDLHSLVNINENQLQNLEESKGDIDIEIESDIESLPEDIEIKDNETKMPDQIEKDREYVRQLSTTIPEFDGKKSSLTRFITALRITDRTKGTQEDLAVEIIKSKIIGPILYKVTNETTIRGIIDILNSNVKGESAEVVKAKLLNIKQKGKTASQYTTEIDNLRKQLETIYIDLGLSAEIADNFATKESIQAMTKNCEYEKLRIILEAGNYNTFSDAAGKYIHCSTEMTGSPSSVLYFNNGQHNYRGNNNYRGHYRGRGRGNRGGYNTNYNNRGNFRGNYRGNNRGRNNSNRGNRQNQNNNNNNNVRAIEAASTSQNATASGN